MSAALVGNAGAHTVGGVAVIKGWLFDVWIQGRSVETANSEGGG